MLGDFIPVPAEGLAREFSSGVSADEVCARTIRAMKSLGARHFYVSNLPIVARGDAGQDYGSGSRQ